MFSEINGSEAKKCGSDNGWREPIILRSEEMKARIAGVVPAIRRWCCAPVQSFAEAFTKKQT